MEHARRPSIARIADMRRTPDLAPHPEAPKAASVLRAAIALVLALAVSVGVFAAPVSATAATRAAAGTASATTAVAPLTNLAHLDFLLDEATPPAEVPGHTTYRLAEEPTLVLPWTYADSRPGGAFQRVGGGKLDEATGLWGQGAYNADDIARAAVVYLRHWALTGAEASRDNAYEMLRSITYLQTARRPECRQRGAVDAARRHAQPVG